MSDETWGAVEDALRHHIADEQGGLLTDWIVTAACVLPDDDEATGYQHLVSKHTAAHARMGLALVTYRHAKAEWDEARAEDDE